MSLSIEFEPFELGRGALLALLEHEANFAEHDLRMANLRGDEIKVNSIRAYLDVINGAWRAAAEYRKDEANG